MFIFSSQVSADTFFLGTMNLSSGQVEYTRIFPKKSTYYTAGYFSFCPENNRWGNYGEVTVSLQKSVNGSWLTVDTETFTVEPFPRWTDNTSYWDKSGNQGDLYRFKVQNSGSIFLTLKFCTINN